MVGTRLIACTNLYVQSVTFYNVHAILFFCVEDSYTTKACNAGYIILCIYVCILLFVTNFHVQKNADIHAIIYDK